MIWLLAETPDYSGGYASGSDWYFQMVFCATTASIVSGTIAERLKIWPFLIFTLVLTGFIYPIAEDGSGAAVSWMLTLHSLISLVQLWYTLQVVGQLLLVQSSLAHVQVDSMKTVQ